MNGDSASTLRRRAVLMTDFAGSTRYTSQVGDAAMGPWWQAQDRIARSLLVRWHGFEIERTDGFVAVFDREDEALACAAAYQQALRESRFPLLARVVVHAGDLTMVPASPGHLAVGAKHHEADGLAKAVAARLLGIARPGQTLATAEVRFSAAVPSGSWRSHGHWSAKGVDEPLEVFELRQMDQDIDPPEDDAKCHRVQRSGSTWVPTRETRHSLPGERGTFVGRTRALGEVSARVEHGARFVSVCGIGGIGKTRLALRFAWTRLGEFPGGAWFCDLSQVSSMDGLCSAVALGLGIALTGDDSLGQIGRAIAGRGRTLVVLDNFEQVVELAEASVGSWLAAAPEVIVIATTRELTGIAGEEAVLIAPMSSEEGAELFARRAAALQPGYSPTAEDRAAIGQLVAALDGLPLALELAAARIRIFSPPRLVERLHQRFDWLWAGRSRNGRQSTLRAAFDWSWDLLNSHEKASIASLSVFDGGFDLVAAESVLTAAAGAADPASMVDALLAKSLLVQDGSGRFRWLESVRQYAAQRLSSASSSSASGTSAEVAAERAHWHHFGGLDEGEAVARASRDLANFVVACRRAVAAGDCAAAPACLRNAWLALRLVGPLRLGLELATEVLAIDLLEPAGRAVGHWVAASANELLGEADSSRQHLEVGLETARVGSNVDIKIRILISLGARHVNDGRHEEAHEALTQALGLAVESRDARLQALALINLGRLREHKGSLHDALGHYDEALLVARRAGDQRLEGGILGNLGSVRRALGQLGQARALFERSVEVAARVGDRRWEGSGRCNLGLACQELGDTEGALHHLDRAASIAAEIGHAALGYVSACNLGIIAAEQGRLDDARDLFTRAAVAARDAGDLRAEGQFRGYLGECQARRGQDRAAMQEIESADRLLSAMDDSLSLALVACQRAGVHLRAGREHEAAVAIEAADRLSALMHVDSDSELGRALSRLRSRQGKPRASS